MFNFNADQVGSFIRTVLKIGGTAATCIGATDPALGAALGTAVTAAGALVAAGGTVWSLYVHRS